MKRLDTFEAISHRDIHLAATAGLLYRGGLYVTPEQLPRTIDEFSELSAFEESGITTYRGVIDKDLCDGEFERTVQLIDLTHQGHVIGAGEVVYRPQSSLDAYRDKPFVGWTKTDKSYCGEGLGRRRLTLMRMSSLACFGRALHSDMVIAHEHVHRIWERFVAEGEAVAYEEQDPNTDKLVKRYQFLE